MLMAISNRRFGESSLLWDTSRTVVDRLGRARTASGVRGDEYCRADNKKTCVSRRLHVSTNHSNEACGGKFWNATNKNSPIYADLRAPRNPLWSVIGGLSRSGAVGGMGGGERRKTM